MNISVIYERNSKYKKQIADAIRILNGRQNYFFYSSQVNEGDLFPKNLIDWNNTQLEFDDETYRIYITEKQFTDNWFSHEERNYAIVSICDWEMYFAPPSTKTYIIYQIAQASIDFAADINEDATMSFVHDTRSEGCMFDLCLDKNDIKLGMISGSICPRCKALLRQYGIDNDALRAIERVLYYVRSEAIGIPMIIDEGAFIVMRFTRNDENDHAFEYGIKPALNNLGIKCSRADNRVSSEQIYNKVKTSIERARFIIAKVDENNLNVFFELGLAMGLDKDVLLISEESLVLQLPSDLKNWECLLYPRGDYGTLKERIIKYYNDNYHIGVI